MKFLRSKKGFTLVEIIVVLVIIAILAAISLPALTGYINDAKEKVAISTGRTAYVAAQTIASELVGRGEDEAAVEKYLKGDETTGLKTSYSNTIESLSGMDTDDTAKTNKPSAKFANITVETNGTVTAFSYRADGTHYVHYSSTGMIVNTTP